MSALDLERAYALLGYSGPMPAEVHSARAAAGIASAPAPPSASADPPALGLEQIRQIEELLEIEPEETVARLREAWDPNLTEPQLRAALDSARALIERPARFLPSLEARAALAAMPAALPAGFEFPGMDLDEIPILPDDHKFEEFGDALGWLAFAAFPSLFPSRKADFPTGNFSYALPEPTPAQPLDVALFSDFGTGRYHSRYIAKQFVTNPPKLAIHCGDVYYAGRSSEFASFFEAPLDPILGATELFMLNSNHEMYSGGKPYFDFLRRKRASHPNQLQEGSYFSLANAKFQITAIDTDYHKHARFPKRDLQEWLLARLAEGRAAGRTNILISANHPYEYGENSFTRLFANDLFQHVMNGLIDLWFWGNTHYCALFDRTNTARFIGSCIGHAGFPYTRKRNGEFSVAPVRFLETRARFPESTGIRQDMGNNGSCRMSLHDNGAITLRYIDWMSTLRCTAELGKTDAASPLEITSVIVHSE